MTQPNILWVFPDQWRGDWIETIGRFGLQTPHVDRLIQRGVSFGRAWTPSPLCAPARACIAVGTEYDASPVRNNKENLPLDAPTFYDALGKAGYQVASCGKSDLLKGGFSWGVDGRHNKDGVDQMACIGIEYGKDSAGKHATVKAAAKGGADPYTSFLKNRDLLDIYASDISERRLYSDPDVPLADWLDGTWSKPPESYTNTAPSPLPEDAYHDNFIGDLALEIMQGFDRSHPWFLIVNFPGPHEPMDVTKEMASAWDGVDLPDPVGCQFDDKKKVATIRRRYAAMLENIDRWLGAFCDALDKSGEADNTLVIFASDHGDMLGDRNLWQKEVPFEPSLNVPMVIAGPDVAQVGHLEYVPANLLDLPHTIMALAGAEIPEDFVGYDLSHFLRGAAPYPRELTRSGLGAWRSVTDGRYKLIVGLDTAVAQRDIQFGQYASNSADTTGYLYDLTADPFESTNLWDDLPQIKSELLRQLRNGVSDNERDMSWEN